MHVQKIKVEKTILHCGIYQQIENNSCFYLMHCFYKSLIVIRIYHHFTLTAANHCCQSLKSGHSEILIMSFVSIGGNVLYFSKKKKRF